MCNFELSGTHRKHRIILDGEMLVWDPVSERNLPFGTLKTAALGAGSMYFYSECILHPHLDKSKVEHRPRPCCRWFYFELG